MARGFYSAIKQAARAADRAQRAAVREQTRRSREAERDRQRRLRDGERNARQAARHAKLRHQEEREDEVALLNEDLAARVEEISSLLLASPEFARPIPFATLMRSFHATVFDTSVPGPTPVAPRADQFRTVIRPLGFLGRLFGRQAKHDSEVAAASERDRVGYESARAAFEADLVAWRERDAQAREAHRNAEAARQREVDEHNRAVQRFQADYLAGNMEAVRDYVTLVLERSVLPAGAVSVAVFNGVVHTIDPGTGEAISPCLISVRVTRDDFSRIVLQRVDPLACLKSLNAAVSRKAEELAPVRPVIEFDMVDHRFVAEEDVISTLERRPNIMDLTPSEFEGLVANQVLSRACSYRLARGVGRTSGLV